MEKKQKTGGRLFDIFFISTVSIVLLSSLISSTLIDILASVLFILLGLFVLMSKKFMGHSVLGKILFYLFHTRVLPKTKYNYLISGFILVFLGLGGFFFSILSRA